MPAPNYRKTKTMKDVSYKKIILKVPKEFADEISDKEIFDMVNDKALTKTEYYRSRCKEFEQKYGIDIDTFKKKLESDKHEKINEWDDLLIWEGFARAYVEWEIKYRELQKCGV